MTATDEAKPRGRGFWGYLRSRPGAWFRRWSYESNRRLAAGIETFKVELEWFKQRAPLGEAVDLSWANAAEDLVQAAQEALEDNDVDRGWRNLQAARRMEICGQRPDELLATAEILRIEAKSKLRSWRKEAVEALIGAAGAEGPVNPHRLRAAAEVRDEHYQNLYYGLALIRGQWPSLFLILFASLASLLFMSMKGWLPALTAPEVRSDWNMLVAVALFGILGQSFSAAVTLARNPLHSRIPELLAHFWMSLLRPAMGAAAALAVFVFILSGVLPLAELNVAAVYGVSFAAGFSERLVIRAVETVAGKSKETGTVPPE